MPFRHLELGERIVHSLDFNVAALGDSHRPGHRVGNLAEHLRHFLRRLEIKLIGRKLHALPVAHGFAGLNAHQHFLGVRIGLRQIVAVVCGHERDSAFAREFYQVAIHAHILLQPLVLHFQKEISLAENIAQPVGAGFGLLVFFRQQRVGHFSAQACRKRDESSAVLGQKLVVHARLIIKPVQVSR